MSPRETLLGVGIYRGGFKNVKQKRWRKRYYSVLKWVESIWLRLHLIGSNRKIFSCLSPKHGGANTLASLIVLCLTKILTVKMTIFWCLIFITRLLVSDEKIRVNSKCLAQGEGTGTLLRYTGGSDWRVFWIILGPLPPDVLFIHPVNSHFL